MDFTKSSQSGFSREAIPNLQSTQSTTYHALCNCALLATWDAWRRKGCRSAVPAIARSGHLHAVLRCRTRISIDSFSFCYDIVSEPFQALPSCASASNADGTRAMGSSGIRSDHQQRVGSGEGGPHFIACTAYLLLSFADALPMGALSSVSARVDAFAFETRFSGSPKQLSTSVGLCFCGSG